MGLVVEPQFKVGNIHADFAIPSRRLVIEIDSKQYHSGDKAYETDSNRNRIYNKHGWKVLRIRGKAILQNGEGLATRILEGEFYDREYTEIWSCNDEDKDDEYFSRI